MTERVVRTIVLLLLLVPMVFVQTEFSRVAVIRANEADQVIDGFGGSCADFYEPLSPEMADFFFTPSGIGLSLLRIQVVPSLADCRSYFGRTGGNCVKVESGATVLKGELAVAQQAIARGVTVWSTPWSPPASMKSNGSFINGGKLLPNYYSGWAQSMADFVSLLKSNGVSLYAISVQNEPDLTTDYGSATFSSQELHDFVPYLHSALRSKGVEETKIMISEASGWNFRLTWASMSDPGVAGDVGILAAHGYGSTSMVAPASFGKHVWQTEDSSESGTYDGGMTDALSWATKIHMYLALTQVNAWHWWFLSDGIKYGNGTDNAALTDINLNYPKRAYVTGQWSKFVRPGWHRIGVSYSGPLQITAFKSADDNSFAIAVVNPGNTVIRQTYVLDDIQAKFVNPWATSSTLSLAPLRRVSVVGSTFTYEMPAQSVVTFTGTADKLR